MYGDPFRLFDDDSAMMTRREWPTSVWANSEIARGFQLIDYLSVVLPFLLVGLFSKGDPEEIRDVIIDRRKSLAFYGLLNLFVKIRGNLYLLLSQFGHVLSNSLVEGWANKPEGSSARIFFESMGLLRCGVPDKDVARAGILNT
jgi:hypothetical protein